MRLPDRSARAVRRPRVRPAATALLLGALAGLALVSAAVAAENAAPNGRGTGGVDVDLGVLDSLPPSPPAGKHAPPARKPSTAKAAPNAAMPPAPSTPAPPVPPPPNFAAPAAPAPATPVPANPVPAGKTAPAAPAPSPAASSAALTAPAPPPPSALPRGGERVGRIAFAGDATILPPEAQATLDGLVERMQGDENLHLMLNGYAANAGDNSATRRTSLARALAVRAYLVDRGIPPMRVDVRAVGSGGGDAPPDRVDLMASERLPASAPALTPSRREDSSR